MRSLVFLATIVDPAYVEIAPAWAGRRKTKRLRAYLERDVVVPTAAGRSALRSLICRPGRRCCGVKPPLPLPPPAAVAGAEELDRVGDDLDALAFAAAVLGLPLAPVEPSLDRHRATL